MINCKNTLKILTLALIVSAIIVAKSHTGIIDTNNIAEILNGLQSSYLAVTVFITVASIASICCVPISWFKAFGAVYFGFIYGLIYGLLATVISASISFLLARYLGKDLISNIYENRVKAKLGDKQKIYLEKSSHLGFLELFILRNLYFIPFSATNYAMGISNINFKTYIISTVVGIVPGTTIYIYLISNSLNPFNIISEFNLLYIIVLVYYMLVFLLNKRYKSQLA